MNGNRNTFREFRRIRRKARASGGAAILESVFSMLVILLVLFGLLQIFHLVLTQMVVDYAAFRTARSAMVGFTDYLTRREGLIKSIPVAGRMIDQGYQVQDASGNSITYSPYASAYQQFAYEKLAIEDYMQGNRIVEYEFWHGKSTVCRDYHCSGYGKQTAETGCPSCGTPSTSLTVSARNSSDEAKGTVRFNRFPLALPMRDLFLHGKSIDVENTVSLSDHASTYLEN